ncbi:hypothetical protein KCP70_13445 [Salmonella enterica subsp. enterica]|nr:hypothetical protein KCP70_13445 [Salmonella enterica subsp. enterica]
MNARLAGLQNEPDGVLLALITVSANDRWLCFRLMGHRKTAGCSPPNTRKSMLKGYNKFVVQYATDAGRPRWVKRAVRASICLSSFTEELPEQPN